MNGNATTVDRRAGPRGWSRASRAAAVIGSVLLAVFLAWVHPALLILVAVVCGIGWLRRSDSDPVHRGPVPRTPAAPSPAPGRVVTPGRSGQRPPSGRVRRPTGTPRHDGATAARRAAPRARRRARGAAAGLGGAPDRAHPRAATRNAPAA